MKLHKNLLINNTLVGLVSENIQLELNTPGRGVFVVKSEKKLKGLVQLSMTWNTTLIPFFMGFIESSTAMDNKQQRLLVKELSAALNFRCCIAQRHTTLEKILLEVTQKTGVLFSVGKSDYSQKDIPTFCHSGGGYGLLDNIGAALNIEKYIWQQMANGSVFVGSYNDLSYSKKIINMPVSRFTAYSSTGTAEIPAIPRFRPGIKLLIENETQYITSVNHQGLAMRITLNKNPWSTAYKKGFAA